jgi:hypothetical protein
MSEQQQKPESFMRKLDQWTDEAVIEPLLNGGGVGTQLEVRSAIREKVLESYRNGQGTRPTAPRPSGFKPRRQPAGA